MKRVLFWGLVMPAVLRRIIPRALLDPPTVVAARHPWLTLAAVGAALAAGGFLVAVSGVVPLKASAGHWPITDWFLHFTMRRSVATHAVAITPPPLDDQAQLLRGATHFDLGCRPCHGSTRDDRPTVALAMLPPPPTLPSRVGAWSTAELFYIVKHGVKFTGMPAWPAQQRDDEVWAVTAFLRRLPQMSQDEYLSLSRGEPEATLALGGEAEAAPTPAIVRETCARCHGAAGLGRGTGGFPVLAQQRPEYLRRALQAYRDGRRHSGVMSSVVRGQTAAALDEAVRYYAGLTLARPADRPPAGADLSRGREIATRGVPPRDVPACIECHGPAGGEKNGAYPALAGQHADYLALQLELLQERRRGGSEYVHLMQSFVDRLSAADVRDVTAFFASLTPP